MTRLTSVFDLNIKVAHFLGFYAKDGHSRKNYIRFVITLLIVLVPFIIIQLVTLTKIERNINVIANTFYLFVVSFNVLFKSCVIFSKSDAIRSILSDLDTTMYQPDSSMDVRKNLKQIKNISIFCTVTIIMTEVLICGYPLISKEKILPVPIWLPFDYTQDYV